MFNAITQVYQKAVKILKPQLPDEILRIIDTVDSERWTLTVNRGMGSTSRTFTDTVGGFVVTCTEICYCADDDTTTEYDSSAPYLTDGQHRRLFYKVQRKWFADRDAKRKEKFANYPS